MPELPEVETVAKQLRQVLVGRTVAQVEVRTAKSWQGDKSRVEGAKILAVTRRAKMLCIGLSNHQNVLIHLKMSGQLLFVDGDKRMGGGHPTANWVNELPSKHTRVIWKFTDGTHLYFNDQRIFGWMRVMTPEEVTRVWAELGPDIIDEKLTPARFYKAVHGRKTSIKQLIMDAALVAGVGNIYACDGLNLAKIAPTRPGASLTPAEVARVLKSVRSVIQLGIKKGGATVHGKFVHVSGLGGTYQNFLRVYNRQDLPCPNCGAPIHKMMLGGRGTFYCTKCQK